MLTKPSSLWARTKRALLGADSFIDSGLYGAGEWITDAYRRFALHADKLHVSGIRRLIVELLSEAATLGTVGLVGLLMLAQPAFRLTSDDFLSRQDLAVTFLGRNGVEIGKRGLKQDATIPLSEFPDHLLKAVFATEDRRFYEHFGIDPVGLVRALTVNARASGVVQGGSTLTQQLAKNIFLTNERSFERKVKEAFLSIWLERRLTKSQILKLYLDRAYMGGGTFGVAAASEYYFGKSVKDISLAEAAMLAGLFKAPTKYGPYVNLPAARARANDVLSNMVDAGFMTEGQVLAARQNPATPVDRGRDYSPDYYLDYAYDEVRKLADAGKLGPERSVIVRTAFDADLQRKAESSIEAALRDEGDHWNVEQSAMVIMEPDGAVRVMVGGRDYGDSQFNRATDSLRQPGSSFKPIVYTTALASGKFHPDTMIVDAPICIVNWCPANFGGKYMGRVTLTQAITHSLNSVPVRLSIALGDGNPKAGRARIIEMAKRLGITTEINDTQSLPIGAVGVNPLEIASVYAVFANGGRRAPPHAAIEIMNPKGQVIYTFDKDGAPRPQVLSTQVETDIVGMMRHVVAEGTGRAAIIPGMMLAGKTGTTNASRDAWFDGYSAYLVGVIWMGNDDYEPTNGMTGGSLPAKTWHEIMAYAHQGLDPKPLPFQQFDDRLDGTPAARAKDEQARGTGVAAPRSQTLSRRSMEVINGIENLLAQPVAVQEVPTDPVRILQLEDGRLSAAGARALR
ncbi:MAG: PBP1A family penicillin-binding protein [Hyphomicrobiales bacterium]|nr:PBP1A family penicillin-binding protein [Hyphomicrobiales bacterium]